MASSRESLFVLDRCECVSHHESLSRLAIRLQPFVLRRRSTSSPFVPYQGLGKIVIQSASDIEVADAAAT